MVQSHGASSNIIRGGKVVFCIRGPLRLVSNPRDLIFTFWRSIPSDFIFWRFALAIFALSPSFPNVFE
jgi:hypothetical protein